MIDDFGPIQIFRPTDDEEVITVSQNINKLTQMLNAEYEYKLTGLDLRIIQTNRVFNIETFHRRAIRILNDMINKVKVEKSREICIKVAEMINKWFGDFEKDYKQQERRQAILSPPQTKLEGQLSRTQGIRPADNTRAKFKFTPLLPGEKPPGSGSGIASYRHIQGGSINTFITAMHQRINIKNIVKYNKSAYVINI
jgi:hypothetical protein